MYIPLGIKTDYSLLKSLIRIPELIKFLCDKNITAAAILDDNLFGSMCFYNECIKNSIKPIIGLNVKINTGNIYLYAKNYNGYQNLLKINTIIQERELTYVDLKSHSLDVICIFPYKSIDIFDQVRDIYSDFYIGYGNDFEKKNALIKYNKCVYVNEVCTYSFDEVKYMKILRSIETSEEIDLQEYSDAYLDREVNEDDSKSTNLFSELINLEIPKDGKYIPHYDSNIEDSYQYLCSLCKKGLDKRLDGKVSKEYSDRLLMELNVINNMGFVDYFLIVYDYVKFAKKNNILVGPGRGSAAGSLVSYCLGITNVDPIEYDLLFERFLNPDRITMPDIDIDFEYTKRDQVINYVKERYGINNVANIMTFGTLGARQVIRDVGKALNVDTNLIDRLSNLLYHKINLKDNLSNKFVNEFVTGNKDIKKVYQVSFKLEGLKRHISTHAAGVVISSVCLDDVIPICYNAGELLTGVTMEYLEDLGLLKMDFLALRNLTIIQNVLELIEEETGKKINLADIPLDDKETINVFKSVDTE